MQIRISTKYVLHSVRLSSKHRVTLWLLCSLPPVTPLKLLADKLGNM